MAVLNYFKDANDTITANFTITNTGALQETFNWEVYVENIANMAQTVLKNGVQVINAGAQSNLSTGAIAADALPNGTYNIVAVVTWRDGSDSDVFVDQVNISDNGYSGTITITSVNII